MRQASRCGAPRVPKYSPDLNPIEQVFRQFKTLRQKVEAEHTTLSLTQTQPSSLNTRPKNAPPT
jgi:transposase